MHKQLDDRVIQLERQLKLVEEHFNAAFWSSLDISYGITLPQRTLVCIVCDFAQRWDSWEKIIDTCMFGGGRLERYRCPKCDCIFGPQKFLDLPERFISQDYNLLYSRYSESDSTDDEIKTFHSLKPSQGGLFLDWGCGGIWNEAVHALREQSFDVWGYEPAAETSSQFIVSDRGEISAKFDGIFSNNVIEHFRDPVAQFEDFRSLLTTNGMMAHSSPCYEYRYAFTRFHTLFLLGRSPNILAERTGFRVVEKFHDGDYINLVYSVI